MSRGVDQAVQMSRDAVGGLLPQIIPLAAAGFTACLEAAGEGAVRVKTAIQGTVTTVRDLETILLLISPEPGNEVVRRKWTLCAEQ